MGGNQNDLTSIFLVRKGKRKAWKYFGFMVSFVIGKLCGKILFVWSGRYDKKGITILSKKSQPVEKVS